MGKLEKARLYSPERPNDVFYVQFNPNTLEYSVGKEDAKVDHSPAAADSGDPTGQSGWAELSMTLFFHTYHNENEYGDVRKKVNRLRPYLGRRDDQNHVNSPQLAFAWGTISLVGHLASMSVSYQMFASDGTPVQAEVQIRLIGEDQDIKADGVNHAKSVEFEKSEAGTWRDKMDGGSADDDPVQDIGWLFDGA